MNYLITGGAGFIGSSLAESLTSAGNNVVILDNFSTGQIKNLDDEIQKTICYLNIPEHITHNDILRKAYLENYLTIVNDQINQSCQHNYVTDDIDIDPDNSMRIYYCSICEKGL